jgi:hypothetical protein
MNAKFGGEKNGRALINPQSQNFSASTEKTVNRDSSSASPEYKS